MEPRLGEQGFDKADRIERELRHPKNKSVKHIVKQRFLSGNYALPSENQQTSSLISTKNAGDPTNVRRAAKSKQRLMQHTLKRKE